MWTHSIVSIPSKDSFSVWKCLFTPAQVVGAKMHWRYWTMSRGYYSTEKPVGVTWRAVERHNTSTLDVMSYTAEKTHDVALDVKENSIGTRVSGLVEQCSQGCWWLLSPDTSEVCSAARDANQTHGEPLIRSHTTSLLHAVLSKLGPLLLYLGTSKRAIWVYW